MIKFIFLNMFAPDKERSLKVAHLKLFVFAYNNLQRSSSHNNGISVSTPKDMNRHWEEVEIRYFPFQSFRKRGLFGINSTLCAHPGTTFRVRVAEVPYLTWHWIPKQTTGCELSSGIAFPHSLTFYSKPAPLRARNR